MCVPSKPKLWQSSYGSSLDLLILLPGLDVLISHYRGYSTTCSSTFTWHKNRLISTSIWNKLQGHDWEQCKKYLRDLSVERSAVFIHCFRFMMCNTAGDESTIQSEDGIIVPCTSLPEKAKPYFDCLVMIHKIYVLHTIKVFLVWWLLRWVTNVVLHYSYFTDRM